jgi:prepilin-type N-terminal cleavage/methylation domain-containing protein
MAVMQSVKKHMNQKGFTIIELLIAMSVFSFVMLIATSGLIRIGQIYYKGIIVSKTQDTSRAIIEEITREVQFSSSGIVSHDGFYGASPLNTVAIKSICIGGMKYTWVVDRATAKMSEVDDLSANKLKHLLWVDTYNGGGCTATSFQNTSRDLLSQNMRLGNFSVSAVGSLFTIVVNIYYGDPDLVENAVTGTGSCVGGSGSQFCANSALTGYTTRRI